DSFELFQVKTVRFNLDPSRSDPMALQNTEVNEIGRILNQHNVTWIAQTFRNQVKQLLRSVRDQHVFRPINAGPRRTIQPPQTVNRKPPQTRIARRRTILETCTRDLWLCQN